MESQVVLISFNTAQIKLVNEEMPWISIGFLNGINETGSEISKTTVYEVEL